MEIGSKRKKIEGIIPELFDLQHILVVNKDNRSTDPIHPQDLSYEEEMSKAADDFTTVVTGQYDYSIMHYTSGTTGKPKGAVHRHQAVVQQKATGKWALDLHDDDIYWCTADPGWVTGTSYITNQGTVINPYSNPNSATPHPRWQRKIEAKIAYIRCLRQACCGNTEWPNDGDVFIPTL